MKATVTTAFPGRRDNSGESETFAVGAIIEGDLARVAIDNKWAEKLGDETEVGSPDEKQQAAQAAVDTAQTAFDAAKTALDAADEAGKPDAQKKHDEAEKVLKAAQAKLAKLAKA